MNEQISAKEVRLIDAEGNQVGVVSLEKALQIAEDAELDLVEVSPNTNPPVCKVLDYGKYKYEQQKKASEARKKQKTVDVKELKMRPTIEDHDFGVKLKNAIRFLKGGDKVKFTIRFRGREMAYQDQGQELMKRLEDELVEYGKVELQPKMEGRQMIMILSPGNASEK